MDCTSLIDEPRGHRDQSGVRAVITANASTKHWRVHNSKTDWARFRTPPPPQASEETPFPD